MLAVVRGVAGFVIAFAVVAQTAHASELGFGPPTTFSPAGAQYIAATRLGADRIVVAYRSDGSSNVALSACNRSGETLSCTGLLGPFSTGGASDVAITAANFETVVVAWVSDFDGFLHLKAIRIDALNNVSQGTDLSVELASVSNKTVSIEAVRTDATFAHFVVTYRGPGNAGRGLVGKVTYGTPPALQLAAPQTFEAGAITHTSCARMTDNRVVIAFDTGTAGRAVIGRVDLATSNWDAVTPFTTAQTFNSVATPFSKAEAVDPGRVFLAYEDGNQVKGIVGLVGSALTFVEGTDETVIDGVNTASLSAEVLAPDSAVVFFDDGTAQVRGMARTVRIVGKTITPSCASTIVSPSNTAVFGSTSFQDRRAVPVFRDVGAAGVGTARIGRLTHSALYLNGWETGFEPGGFSPEIEGSLTAGSSIQSATVRTGNWALSQGTTPNKLIATSDFTCGTQAETGIRFGFFKNTAQNNEVILKLSDGTSDLLQLDLPSAGGLRLTDNGLNGFAAVTSPVNVSDGVWHVVKILYPKGANTAIRVWVDGTETHTVTHPNAVNSVRNAFLGGPAFFDDIYVSDAPGPPPDGGIVALRPTGPGASTMFTAVPAPPNWQVVADNPISITSYVTETSMATVSDQYSIAGNTVPLGNRFVLKGVWMIARGNGSGTHSAVFAHGGTRVTFPQPLPIVNAYHGANVIFASSPSGTPWGSGNLLTAEIGVEGTGGADTSLAYAAVMVDSGMEPAPTADGLLYLRARATRANVMLEWEPAFPLGPSFEVFRAASAEGPFERVAEAVTASGVGAFTWRDEDVREGREYFYEVGPSGGSVKYGPVSAVVPAGGGCAMTEAAATRLGLGFVVLLPALALAGARRFRNRGK